MSNDNLEKKKALEAALGQIEKQFGKGSIMKLGEYQEKVETILKEEDQQDTEVKLNYGQNYFPEKVYGGVIYKEGYYESLVVTLGDGQGKNWWCVLFPPLCSVEAESKEQASEVEYKFFVKDLITKYFK